MRVALTSALAGAVMLLGGSYKVASDVRSDIVDSLPALKEYHLDTHTHTTKVLSRDGKLVATLFRQHKQPVPFKSMGTNIVKAIVAIEDSRFFQHHGVDYWGVARAAYANFTSGTIEQGASTLTMQLARRQYLSQEKSYERKIKEALLAQEMERCMTKHQILEAYLNDVYFGAGAYGVAAAANRYFHTTPDKLTLAQAALLAGLVQSPSELSPDAHPRAARHRQVLVLQRMQDLDMITSKQHRQALRETISMNFDSMDQGPKKPLLKYPYFTTYAIRQAAAKVGENHLYEDGLTIQTTLDLKAQRMLQRVMSEQLKNYGPSYGIDSGAAVLIYNPTGEIRAMVGGKKWSSKNCFNRAWQARRQPGSSFKPFLYSTALQSGYGEDTLVADKKVTYKVDHGRSTWTPMNSDGRELGNIPLREALRLSRNQAAAYLINRVGIEAVIDTAHRCGITSDLPAVPSVALGSVTVSPLEMATAYSTLANQGTAMGSTCFREVKDADGKTVYNGKQRWTRWALDPDTAATITDMMCRVVRAGTGQAAYIPGLQVAGKTGTTDSFKDAWFVGFTPDYTLAVWMGNNDNSPTYSAYGGGLPAATWRKIMAQLPQRHKTFGFLRQRPVQRTYCKVSHHLAGPECKKRYKVQYLLKQLPRTETCEKCETLATEGGESVDDRFSLGLKPNYPVAERIGGSAPSEAGDQAAGSLQ